MSTVSISLTFGAFSLSSVNASSILFITNPTEYTPTLQITNSTPGNFTYSFNTGIANNLLQNIGGYSAVGTGAYTSTSVRFTSTASGSVGNWIEFNTTGGASFTA